MGRADSPLRDRMVFLVGAQRSGTNWLQRMLATHPQVVALPSETQLFTSRVAGLAGRVQHGTLGSTATGSVFMERDVYLDALRAFYDAAFSGAATRLDSDALRVVERSPNHAEQLAHIAEVYPDSWVIHLIRDGRDVARSLVSQPWGPDSVREAADTWARSVRSARAAGKSLERYLEVRYEELVADPVSGMSTLCEFLGLDLSAATAEAVRCEAGVAYNTDPRRPVVGDGKWQVEWRRRELDDFDAVAGDVLSELGYPPATALRVTGRRLPIPAPVRRIIERRTASANRPVRQPLPMELRQRRVDALCAALAAGDAPAATALLAPNASVRIGSAAGRDRLARGAAGRALLTETLLAEGAWGRQHRGDVHVSGAVFTVVLTHERAQRTDDRLVIVSFDGDGQVVELDLYLFPLSAPPGQPSE